MSEGSQVSVPVTGVVGGGKGTGRAEAESVSPGRMRRLAAFAQAAYYLPTGVWPLVSPSTFQLVTGRKSDVWLAQTVGALITVAGASLAVAARDQRSVDSAAVRTLAIGSAVSLAAVDVIFVSRRRISPIYLADAVIELAIVAAWLTSRTMPQA